MERVYGPIEEYQGPLNVRQATGFLKKGYLAITHQKSRCYDKNCPEYKNYGAKGIVVEYNHRQFLAWYLKEAPKFYGKEPQVGRINHSGNYCFSNIRLESRSENSRESRLRNNINESRQKRIGLFTKNGEQFAEFKSVTECAEFLETTTASVRRAARGMTPKFFKYSWHFKYL